MWVTGLEEVEAENLRGDVWGGFPEGEGEGGRRYTSVSICVQVHVTPPLKESCNQSKYTSMKINGRHQHHAHTTYNTQQ